MDDTARVFHPDQIKIHKDLAMILKDYTKAVIRKNPETKEEILEFSKWYFTNQVSECTPEPTEAEAEPIESKE